MVVYRLSERSRGSGPQLKHSSAGPRGHCLGAHGQFPMIAGIALIFAMAAFSIPLSKMPAQNVTQIIAGDNITVSPENGYGAVTINSTGVGANGAVSDNNVTKIVAGDNIVISPENGYGEVTVTAIGENGNLVSQLIAGENITISGATGAVTVSAAGYNATDLNVVQLIAGENITITPDNGYGTVTITAAGENETVTQIIAGTNITISPMSGIGTVTINSSLPAQNVTRIIAGENVTISPDNGYGDVTITGVVTIDNIRPSQLYEAPVPADDGKMVVYEEAGDMFTWITKPTSPWTLVSDTTLDSDATSIIFSDVDMVGSGPYLLYFMDNTGASGTDRRMYFNGDTINTHYYVQMLSANNTTITASRQNSPIIVAGDGNVDGVCIIHFTQIVGGYPRWIEQAHRPAAPASVSRIEYYGAWDNTQNVTTITIQASGTDGLRAGSRFILMRVT